MLEVEQPRGEPDLGMVVDKRDRAGHDTPAELVLMLHELLADHLRDRVRAAGVTAFGYHVVQLVKKRDGERDADAGGSVLLARLGHAERAAVEQLTCEQNGVQRK